jgi:hypothetical protein
MLLNELIVDENNMGFVPSVGASFQMNDTAKEVVELLKQGKEKDEIVELLATKYNLNPKEVYIDVMDFLEKLKIYGII